MPSPVSWEEGLAACVRTPSGCLEWQHARTSKGYGRFKEGYAHRESAKRAGKLITGKVVRHSCDNPRCIEPNHLEPGTQSENLKDMVERGRRLYAGTDNARAILTEAKVRAIRQLKGTLTARAIGKLYGVGKATIVSLLAGKTWRHVK